MIIKCPWCGERDLTEFKFGGEAHVRRPEPAAGVSDCDWAQYMFYRKNTKGVHHERWLHLYGCRQWFNMARDTVTHEIFEVYEMTEQPSVHPQASDDDSA